MFGVGAVEIGPAWDYGRALCLEYIFGDFEFEMFGGFAGTGFVGGVPGRFDVWGFGVVGCYYLA